MDISPVCGQMIYNTNDASPIQAEGTYSSAVLESARTTYRESNQSDIRRNPIAARHQGPSMTNTTQINRHMQAALVTQLQEDLTSSQQGPAEEDPSVSAG